MDLKREDPPPLVEALEKQEDKKIRIGGQASGSHSGEEKFEIQENPARIKEKKNIIGETNVKRVPAYQRHPFLTGLIMVLIILAIIPVAIYEFTKSWIRYYIPQKKNASSQSYTGG